LSSIGKEKKVRIQGLFDVQLEEIVGFPAAIGRRKTGNGGIANGVSKE